MTSQMPAGEGWGEGGERGGGITISPLFLRKAMG